jgi:hypothetical protein
VVRKFYDNFKEIAARSDQRAARSLTKVPLNNETTQSNNDIKTKIGAELTNIPQLKPKLLLVRT